MMICPKCGCDVADGARFCPVCGEEIVENPAIPAEDAADTGMINDAVAPLSGAAPDAASPVPEKSAADAKDAELESFYASEEDGKKKKKSRRHIGKKILIGLAAVIVLIGLLIGAGFIFFPKQTKFVLYRIVTFDSSEKCFRYLEREEIKKFSEDFSVACGAIREKNSSSPVRIDADAKIDGNFIDSYIEPSAGKELSWLEDCGATLTSGSLDGVRATELNLRIGDGNVFTAEYAADADGKMYLCVPQLDEKYVSFDEEYLTRLMSNIAKIRRIASDEVSLDDIYSFGDEDDESVGIIGGRAGLGSPINLFLKMLRAAAENAPDGARAKELATKYIKLAIGKIEKIDREKATYTVDGKTVNCTAYVADLKEEDINRIIKAVLEEAKGDEDLKKIFDGVVAELVSSRSDDWSYGFETEGLTDYETFIEKMTDVIDNEHPFSKLTVKYKLLATFFGDIVGREIYVVPDGETTLVYTNHEAPSGNEKAVAKRLALEFERGALFEFTVDGHKKDGIFDGKAAFRFNMDRELTDILTADFEGFDSEAVLRGEFFGKVTVYPGEFIKDRITASEGKEAGLFAGSAKLLCEAKYEDGVQYFDITLKSLIGDVATVNATVRADESFKVSLPDEENVIPLESDTSISKWVKEWNVKSFVEGFRNAGLPDDMCTEIESTMQKLVQASQILSVFK